ncbi:hypothetical protein PF008_g13070 [Phytophthora fragariae]|uniref:Uncharacterized protein n=1 Tax=Phytophthora fragariae TaxID=53985 RepID=A0A6G0RL06_9STRA|nr:hypothetical protein PF008_g13070 [Phytophthora fragariae]
MVMQPLNDFEMTIAGCCVDGLGGAHTAVLKAPLHRL